MNDIYFLKDTWKKIKSLISINNLAYLIGTLFILFAMERLMYLVRISYDRTGLLLSILALSYALIFIVVGRTLQHSDRFSIVSPLLFTLALAMIPSCVQGIQHHFNLWASYGDKSVYLTLIAQYGTASLIGLIIWYWTKIPFLVMPFLYFTWSFLTCLPQFFTAIDSYLFVRGYITIALSTVVFITFFFMHTHKKERVTFWGYLSAIILFQHGLHELVYSGYQGPAWLKMAPFFNAVGGEPQAYLFFKILLACFINIGLVIIALRLSNYIVLAGGAHGTARYLILLLRKIFDIYDFHAGLPLILSVVGISILLLTVLKTTDKTGKKISPKITFCAYILSTVLLLAAAGAYTPFLARISTSALLLSITTILYAGIFVWIGRRLRLNAQTKYGGLSFTLAVGMVPYFVYGMVRYFDFGSPGDWLYYAGRPGHLFNVLYLTPLTISAVTVVVTLITIYLTRSSFLMIPLIISSWYLCTRTYLLMDKSGADIIFGLCMVLLAYFIDRRTKENCAFWGYLGGMLFIQMGLAESARLLYTLNLSVCLAINFLFIVLSIVLNNKIIGAISTAGLLIYGNILINKIFAGIISAPLLLSLTGIAIILCTIVYMKNQEKIDKVIQQLLPTFLLKYRPENRTN